MIREPAHCRSLRSKAAGRLSPPQGTRTILEVAIRRPIRIHSIFRQYWKYGRLSSRPCSCRTGSRIETWHFSAAGEMRRIWVACRENCRRARSTGGDAIVSLERAADRGITLGPPRRAFGHLRNRLCKDEVPSFLSSGGLLRRTTRALHPWMLATDQAPATEQTIAGALADSASPFM